MGTKYSSQSASGYNSSPPADDGSQVAANLVTWAGVKTKLADPIKTLADAENTALVTALDLSARAISGNDTAIASDHWKTLQVTGATTITLSSAASMGAGYEVEVFNAGVGVVTVTPGGASDTINGVSASVTVSIKGTKIFRTNQALTGYNVVGGSDPQTLTTTTNVVTPLVNTSTLEIPNGGAAPTAAGIYQGSAFIQVRAGASGFAVNNNANTTSNFLVNEAGSVKWGTGVANFGTVAKRKTADESVTNAGAGTTLQDDDHLTFSIAANEEWIANFDVDFGANIATTGFKVAITTPAAATLRAFAGWVGNSLTEARSSTITTSGTAIISQATGLGSATVKVQISVWVLNGANAGSITLQWAQGTASATALTANKGSFMQATRVA